MSAQAKGAAESADRIRSVVLRDGFAGAEAMALLDEALAAHPESSALWCLRGDLIQLQDDDGRIEIDEAAECYLKAAALAPDEPEPIESLGHFYDCILDDPAGAVQYFRKAIALGAGQSARDGLAEVLEQLDDEGV